MSLITKILSFVFGGLLVVSLVFGGYNLYQKYKYKKLNTQLNQQLMEAKLEIGKAKSEFGDAEKKIGELDSALRAEIKSHQETIIAYGELEAKYNASSGGTGVGTVEPVTEPVKPGDKFKIGQWYIAITDSELVEMSGANIEYKDFRLDISSFARPTKKWDSYTTETHYQLHQKFFGQIVQSTTKSGAVNHYLNLWELDDTGKKVGALELERFDVVVQKPNGKNIFWWAPHVDIGAFLGTNTQLSFSGGASFGFTTSGYGYTKNDLSWKFLRLGVDVSEGSIGFSFLPAQYNIANLLPLVSNLYIGPYASLTTSKQESFGLLLSVGL